ncbi:glycosyltransferase [Humisphaera borealis]|uniref:Glycosyltransferase n=1 Tax=Humisphaera borealis TaxID=2807512 RepID=A0A7M2X0I8_9BACT|nr:glycosyltransferase [Humisphaera borealis]QOV91276.1 glycosyltransferase [Humisphaera borealis]
MSREPIKVLFVAFGCEPGRGSEPGVGWGFVDEESRRRPVWVLTHAQQKEALDNYIATKHKHYAIHPVYVSLPGLGWLWKSHFGINVYYYLWQLKAGRIGRKLHAKIGFDIVQHVSFTRYWMHTAAAMVGAPFVFGPVGGGDSYPAAFWSELRFGERLREYYWKIVRLVMEHDPLLVRTLRRARATIASGAYAREQLERLGSRNVDVMCAVAPTPQLPPPGPGPGPGDVFRFVSVGRVPRWKGVHLSLQAFAKAFGPGSANAGNQNVHYTIIGEGSDLSRLKQMAQDLGVADRVTFAGDLPYAACLEHLATAGAVLHTALRDSAGLVFEALSLGVPVACCDIGTPSLLVDDTSGAVIPSSGGPDDVIARVRDVMLRWHGDLDHYRTLRAGAAARSRMMSRAARGDMLEKIYERVAKENGSPSGTSHGKPEGASGTTQIEGSKGMNGRSANAESAMRSGTANSPRL